MSAGLPMRVEGLTHGYVVDGERTAALVDVSFSVGAGERLTVVGPSGSGKSTLLTVLAGLQRPTAGRVWIGDEELTALPEGRLASLRRRSVSVVVQDPRRNLLPYGTAIDNIRFAQRPAARSRARRDPEGLLRSLGLEDLAGRPVDGLSGGERQRIAIAAGLAVDPDVLLLDEPTSSLDAASREGVVDLIERAVDDAGATLVTITHDVLVAERLGGVLELAEGRIVR